MALANKPGQKPVVWSISGSDCSGGAGIAADIKTGHGLGVEVCCLITANTVQNSQQVLNINPVNIDILQQQVDILLEDKPPGVIKIGLVANSYQLNWLALTLGKLKQQLPGLKVIYDPVGQASAGGVLSSLTSRDISALLPLVDVLTPNLQEAQTLTGLNQISAAELAQAVTRLGAKACIIKGGHKPGNSCDDYCLDSGVNYAPQAGENGISYRLTSPRYDTSYSHGGGCSFASALSAFIAHGYLLRDALTLTKAFINQGLSACQGINDYYGAFEQLGWPAGPEYFPKVMFDNGAGLNGAFAPLGIRRPAPREALKPGGKRLGLYPVIDSLAWLERLLPLGLEIIQLRIKNTEPDQLEQMVADAVKMARAHNTRLFINDHWQLAIKYQAYGVHLGQEDLHEADLAQIQAAGLRLGISTHGCYEFLLAQQLKPSYLAIGAIYDTQTKDMTGQIQGLENLSQLLTLATDIPVVAIGGINLERAADVWQTGVDSLAVVTAITRTADLEQAVRHFRHIMTG
ncbi:thiamine phosphate synthase [Thalassomonas viridans]|uniref:Thiamine-phosphate synthase n=1 Tax=Thalassomonas viridans TaxID=137584 RepID=A0AAF0C9V7_9GAMM|nr:thiamine phosphate synthase [Thalassomonas viridans]WDE05234.1 thiamine phosphate synthase [Thalassomonas viridans]